MSILSIFRSSYRCILACIRQHNVFIDLFLGLQNTLDGVLLSFKRFDFLWQDDLQVLFKAFSDASPGLPAFHREVERLQKIERDLVSTPDKLELGPLVLSTIPIKDCLYGFAIAWKICYAQPIHESAKV